RRALAVRLGFALTGPVPAASGRARLHLHLDVETLLECADALLQVVAMVDILTIAEERAVLGRALSLAIDLEVGVAVRVPLDLALRFARDAAFDLALPLAARLAPTLAGHLAGLQLAAR